MAQLKFLIDVGVGKKVEDFLSMHHDVKSVRTLDPKMPDKEILKIAAHEDRVVITMDKDFGELVYHSKMHHAGVLLLRLENATGLEKVNVVAKILNIYSDLLYGNFSVYANRKLRVRKENRT